MDPPANDLEVTREKLEEVKEPGPMHHCNLFDTEVTYKIAQALLMGLASACVDNTMGGIFKTPGSVAVEIRKEMVDSLTQRSETFVAEAVVLEGVAEPEAPDHPYDIISDFIDDFASSKRNFFSRVSGWLLSDRREDRIDDFVQEMEVNGFWLMGRREAVAQTLLKNVDFKDMFHCNKKFNYEDELRHHLPQCSFRTIDCSNEGCDAQFTAGNMEAHDSVCPFKMLPCEQKCSDILMRREMDRHCITVCPMKLVNCPFSSVGCQSTIPRCTLEQHNAENLHSHALFILQGIHKDVAIDDLRHRVEQLEKYSPGQLERARDVRSLTRMIKNIEPKLGPLEIKPKVNESEEVSSTKEESADSTAKEEESSEPPSKEEESSESPSKSKDSESPTKHKDSIDSSAVSKETPSSTAKNEEHLDSPTKKEELVSSPAKKEVLVDSPAKKEEQVDSPTKKEELVDSPAETEDPVDSSSTKPDNDEHTEPPNAEKNVLTDSSTNKEEHVESLNKEEESSNVPRKEEESTSSPTKREEQRESVGNGEGTRELPKESEETQVQS